MFPQGQRPSFGFGATLTPVGKKMLIMYASIYVLVLICEHWLAIPIYGLLALSPPGSGFFHFWQIVTHPLVHDPGAPIGFLINCLVFYFFAGIIESALGTRRFITLYCIAAAGAMVIGLPFSRLAAFSFPYAGMMASLLALIVIFGLLNPEATILLMFVLPIKAKYISYGTVVVTALTFLAKANVHGAYHLGGILFAYLYFRPPGHFLNANWWRWKYFEFTQKRRRSRFTVIDGKNKDNNDKPTIH
jgi:membrane associated rhomboid family serine protease